jgi:hypothetical protein
MAKMLNIDAIIVVSRRDIVKENRFPSWGCVKTALGLLMPFRRE